MATAYGSGNAIAKQLNVASCNIAATATLAAYIIPTGMAGELLINDCFGEVTTSIAGCNEDGSLRIRHTPSGGSIATVGTYTVENDDDQYDLITFTPASSYVGGKVVLAAGDTITVDTVADTAPGAGVITTHLVLRLWKL